MFLETIAEWFTTAILIAGALHGIFFLYLWGWAHRDLKNLAQSLDEFTAGLPHRSRLDWKGHLPDQIDAFVADVHEALHEPASRKIVGDRLRILDERRVYLDSYRFETACTVARSGIEAYPLLGVLGTIFALWLALRATPQEGNSAVGEIISRFGLAIDSTFAGLAVAIVLMIFSSLLETLFRRVLENRRHVRDLVHHAKRELMGSGSDQTTAGDAAFDLLSASDET